MTAVRALLADQSDFVVREARPSDNPSLVALAAACPMVGDLTLRIDRRPDFFALNRLEGENWRLAVAERGGSVVGCAGFSERRAFVNGREMRTGYAGDLKVHPDHRNTTIADALSLWAEAACSVLPATAPAVITVLAGNRAMERRLSGRRGIPRFRKIGTIRSHSIPILWKRKARHGEAPIEVTHADWSDVQAMTALWSLVARERQLAPVMTPRSLSSWIRKAPGLDISSYRLARSPDGTVLGFIGVWDQRPFKQLTVAGYSRRLSAVRYAFNVLAPFVGAERLPKPGSSLRCASVVHLCVPPNRPDVLRALLVDAYNEMRRSRFSFLNIGLDVQDPLSSALSGLLAQPTDVNAYMLAERGGVAPENLDVRPIHYEIALV